MKSEFVKNYNLPVCKYRGSKQDIKYPCYASLKIDGELQYVIKKDNKVFSVNKSKYGRKREDYPALEEFKRLSLPDGIYLCELYWNEGKTKEDFYGLLRNRNSDELKLVWWGLLQQYDEIYFTAEKVFNYLSWYLKETKNFKYFSVIPFWTIYDKDDLNILIDKYIYKLGYEGLVVFSKDAVWREGSTNKIVKIKERKREENTKNKNNKVNLKLNKYGIWL
ncbi:hypothetical protein DRN69_01890 [Candidatus Pacearchaeota archaeon]|nr:MAG: hypothetical protein DRN69_01890 [Candidatus Pacearchaeota archaeon]